jgi:hypothetical protein
VGGLEGACCEELCRSCSETCEQTAEYCIARGGRLADRELLRALVSCAAVARYLADLFRDDADLAGPVVYFFAEACDHCLEQCGRVGDDAQLERCAAACSGCAECAHELAALAESGADSV